MGFDNQDFYSKTDNPFSLPGIRQGPLSESDCSSLLSHDRFAIRYHWPPMMPKAVQLKTPVLGDFFSDGY